MKRFNVLKYIRTTKANIQTIAMPLTTKPLSLKINAALFDVDGTIIISQPAIAAFWRDFGKDKPYFDADNQAVM